MAKRNIVTKEDEVLQKVCRPVERFDEKLWALLDDMAETLYAANGVGLAAPQVGILRRAVVIDIGEGLLELVNPSVVKSGGKQRDVEGCLSCPGMYGYVTRPQKCRIQAQDRNGNPIELECKDLMARAACHEIDHLDGKLFLDLVEEFVDVEEEK